MKKIGEGHKSEVFLLPDGRILKLFVPQFASLAPEESELSRMLADCGVQAPRVAETIELDGRPGIVFDNLKAGETLASAVRRKPWRIVTMARHLARLHAAVHAFRSSELPSQRVRLAEEIRGSEAVMDDARHEALRMLAGLPDDQTVCHNDIHMLNVIVHPEEWMIIDWALATRGNPLADVAAALLQLRFGEQPRGFLAKTALESGRALFCRAYLRQYLGLRPGQREQLDRWELPVAVALAGRREGRMRSQLVQRVEALIGRGRGRPASVQS
jgi:aminoglycoside phosphotransferase (APT) family kinase protein